MYLLRVAGCAGLLIFTATTAAAVNLDAPELSRAGSATIGVMEKHIVHRGQVDPTRSVAEKRIRSGDRILRLMIWYPAQPGGQPTPYRASLSSPRPLPPKSFALPALAVRDAAPMEGSHPVVIVSHGFSNDPAMMSWLGENLATKGYVVVAIAHDDPGYTELNRLIEPLLWRPLDIAYVAHEIRAGFLGPIADPGRIALIGYSMGGYGVLTAAGVRLDATESPFRVLPPSPAVIRMAMMPADWERTRSRSCSAVAIRLKARNWPRSRRSRASRTRLIGRICTG